MKTYTSLTVHRSNRCLFSVYPTANDFLYFPDQIFDDGLDTWGVPQIYLFSKNMNVIIT
jgi:hypothetical protein